MPTCHEPCVIRCLDICARGVLEIVLRTCGVCEVAVAFVVCTVVVVLFFCSVARVRSSVLWHISFIKKYRYYKANSFELKSYFIILYVLSLLSTIKFAF